MNLLLPQIDDRGFYFRLVLYALQLDPGQVDLGQVAGIEAGAADVDDLVLVIQVGLGQLQHRLGLQRLHKRRAQAEDQVALEVHVLRCGDFRAFLGALEAQFALVFALVQIAEVGLFNPCP